MIKVYKLKVILIAMLVIVLFASFIFISINKLNYKSVQTSISNNSTYKILVDVEDSKLFLFENNELVKTYKCSGGKQSTPSPIGTWTVISKAKWGEGFGRKLDGTKCSMGSIWNTWNFRQILGGVGKLAWMYKDE